ncbi:MAG: hypothetical protein JNK30_18365 [Phenylobacterium sp.]|uniref:hypothetical protein n=1 Tax=Phenylobacterium sp. TaxID=1871053 RepID=UPI001A3DF5E0|nr:hypothetical protein [Phenylobacterium sp.]MBL8773354.1 hypothetical protein [Phenylobacterium sp.]
MELSFDDVESLIEGGHLPAWDEADPDAIAVAILLLIRRTVTRDGVAARRGV